MRRRIAIVEDDPVIRANYADVLKKHGYDVAAYADRGKTPTPSSGCATAPSSNWSR